MEGEFLAELYNYLSPPIFGAVGWLFARRKYKAETTTTELANEKSAIDIWRELGQHHVTENDGLKGLVKELQEAQKKCHSESETLRKQVLRYSIQLAEVRAQMSAAGYVFDPNLLPPEDDNPEA